MIRRYWLWVKIYISAFYYNEIFYYVVCCNTADAVDRDLKNLNNKSSKLLDLKDNIRVRVIGLGWKDLSTHWYNNEKSFTQGQLSQNDSIKAVVPIHAS